jgi:hypothetical protein
MGGFDLMKKRVPAILLAISMIGNVGLLIYSYLQKKYLIEANGKYMKFKTVRRLLLYCYAFSALSQGNDEAGFRGDRYFSRT